MRFATGEGHPQSPCRNMLPAEFHPDPRHRNKGDRLWPPSDWVDLDLPGLGMKRYMHRSGLELIALMYDGEVIVHRGNSQATRYAAGQTESFLVNAGFVLVHGGLSHATVIYRLSRMEGVK